VFAWDEHKTKQICICEIVKQREKTNISTSIFFFFLSLVFYFFICISVRSSLFNMPALRRSRTRSKGRVPVAHQLKNQVENWDQPQSLQQNVTTEKEQKTKQQSKT
jgi:hypothetical protein